MAEHPEVRGFGRDAATCPALRKGLSGLDARVDRAAFRAMLDAVAREPGTVLLVAGPAFLSALGALRSLGSF